MDFNFGSNTQSPAGQWGLGSDAFNFGGNPNPGYNSMAAWGMPNTSMATPSATGGFGGYTPSAAGSGGIFGSTGLGMNIPTLQLGFQGLSSLASLYGGLKSLGMAQDQFNFQKNLANTNLANSVQSYNTNLTDKATARGVAEGQTPGQVQSYINSNKLST